LSSALGINGWTSDIPGVLTVLTILQYLEAHQCIDPIQLSAGEPDRFIWRWTSSGQFSSKSAYTTMFVGESAILGSKELWRTRTPNKCMFFIWLSILGRCWTSDRLFRHGLRDDNVRTLCCQGASQWITCCCNVCSAAKFGSKHLVEWAGNTETGS
jgi:hypothetical protein